MPPHINLSAMQKRAREAANAANSNNDSSPYPNTVSFSSPAESRESNPSWLKSNIHGHGHPPTVYNQREDSPSPIYGKGRSAIKYNTASPGYYGYSRYTQDDEASSGKQIMMDRYLGGSAGDQRLTEKYLESSSSSSSSEESSEAETEKEEEHGEKKEYKDNKMDRINMLLAEKRKEKLKEPRINPTKRMHITERRALNARMVAETRLEWDRDLAMVQGFRSMEHYYDWYHEYTLRRMKEQREKEWWYDDKWRMGRKSKYSYMRDV